MSKSLHLKLTSLLLPALMATSAATAAPGMPDNLQADVNGLIVDLTWDWGNLGERILYEDFEGDKFPPAGWDWEKTYTYSEDGVGNWMPFSFTEEDDMTFAHSGISTAVLMLAQDYDESDPSTMHQNEWLYVTPGKGAEYMDFWYYIHPELLNVGSIREFPDHYYVLISRDGGDTWTELWDGRWDITNEDCVRQASIFLGEPCDDDTIVAFNGLSDEFDGLYYLWAIDDVEFYTAAEAAQRKLNLKAKPRVARSFELPEGMVTHREFNCRPEMKRVARIPEEEWLNNGQTTFRVYLDDEIIGDYLKRRYLTDVTGKENGKHTYRVMAWNEAEDLEYEAAEVEVNIDDFIFGSPRNVKAISYEEPAGSGRYSIEVEWEAPETEMRPSYYEIYINGKWYGQVPADEEFHAGQSGMYPGIYTFGVQASYTYPIGKSDMIMASTFPGTLPAPVELTVDETADGYRLGWNFDKDAEMPEGFEIYRGDDLLVTGLKDMDYSDSEVADGLYTYSVHARYADGTLSLPAQQQVLKNAPAVATLPFTENFDNGHLPANWEVELIDPQGRVKDMYKWRFDNWFDIEYPESIGIEGNFASITTKASGMLRLESSLYLPELEIPAEEGKVPVMEFTKYFNEPEVGVSGPAYAEVQGQPAGAEEWVTLTSLTNTDHGLVSLPLDKYAGNRIKLRYIFLGRQSGELIVDNLKVTMKDTNGVEIINPDATVDVLDITGMTLLKGVTPAEASLQLNPGIYLIRSSQGVFKVKL